MLKEGSFGEDVKIRYSEMDLDTVLKPSALLQFLQDLASDNAESLGFGYSYIVKNNLAWFLLKYRIEFCDYPKGLYKLHIKTEPRGYNKIFAFRDFEIIYDNKIIGRAATTWALVDLKTKAMANVAEILKDNPYMVQHEKRKDDLSYGKIKPIQKIDKELILDIRYDDLDVNRHVNNANYISWAFEPLGLEFRKNKKPKIIDIVFKKEITYGAKVISQVEIFDDVTVHVLKNAETHEDLCYFMVEWVDNK